MKERNRAICMVVIAFSVYMILRYFLVVILGDFPAVTFYAQLASTVVLVGLAVTWTKWGK